MKETNKGLLDDDVVITEANIQKIGEIIALKCVKTVIAQSGKDLYHLYRGLVRDMHRTEDNYTAFSNAYDIAQEAMLFLCRHMGEKLGDDYITKHGKVITVKRACFRYTDRFLDKQYTRHLIHTVSLNEEITSELVKIPDEEPKDEDAAFDSLIAKMKLKPKEYETLCAYMAGITYIEISRFMNVNPTTIWRRKMNIKKKYILATNSL